ncbi:hypothetical protein PHYPSEUDO_004008 [Phytophthora pseudosyringae]|uniref:ABC transporter domain-containing protein n=1 Tax=Phytophthora pseudosyringae TaxID=221518 RepID=A0A8T1VQB9_9STRA|nr:hypothetical protein PHYPSEUDO_004008 [Phytophthora pseudosyringae]
MHSSTHVGGLAMGRWFFFLSTTGPNTNVVTPLDADLHDFFSTDTKKSWVAYGIIYTIAIYVIFMFLSFLVLEFLRYGAPENVHVSEKMVEDDPCTLAATSKSKDQTNEKGEVIVEIPVGREKNFTPVTVAFQDLHYWVPDPHNPKEKDELLKGINGFAVPEPITALMGSSSAGKTTLMNVLAGRRTGGKILLNGYEASDLATRRSTGYCEQMVVHSEASTIREALTFSSFLRQDASIPDAKKYDSVNECIQLLGLEDIADQIIRGSSVEQMKRLAIGVELGLLLLKRGGETVFFGELGTNCRNRIDYFRERSWWHFLQAPGRTTPPHGVLRLGHIGESDPAGCRHPWFAGLLGLLNAAQFIIFEVGNEHVVIFPVRCRPQRECSDASGNGLDAHLHHLCGFVVAKSQIPITSFGRSGAVLSAGASGPSLSTSTARVPLMCACTTTSTTALNTTDARWARAPTYPKHFEHYHRQAQRVLSYSLALQKCHRRRYSP